MCGSKKAVVKKMWNPRWQQRNGRDGRLMVKFLFQVNLYYLLHVSLGLGTWIVVIAISLLPQPFLSRHLGFHIIFTMVLLGAAHFLQLGFFFTSFCKRTLWSWQFAIIEYLLLRICLIRSSVEGLNCNQILEKQ